eukprot:9405515-Ditylum_brightwellii.AAC.1
MDANDTDQANSDFRKFYSKCNLVDVFAHLHPGITPPHTYQRSDNRIDYIFITPALILALRSTEILMMGNTNNPVDAAWRNLVSGNPKGSENYCETLQTQVTQQKNSQRSTGYITRSRMDATPAMK